MEGGRSAQSLGLEILLCSHEVRLHLIDAVLIQHVVFRMTTSYEGFDGPDEFPLDIERASPWSTSLAGPNKFFRWLMF